MKRFVCLGQKDGPKFVQNLKIARTNSEGRKKGSVLFFLFGSLLFIFLIHCNPLAFQNTCDPFNKDFHLVFLLKAAMNDKSATCGLGRKVSANLRVTNVYPSDGSSSVLRGANIRFSFTESIDTRSLTMQADGGFCSGSIQMSSDDFVSCEGGTIDVSTNPSFQIIPKKILKGGSNYKIRITTDILNSSGESMANVYSSTNGFYTNGSWAYVTNATTGEIWMFTIDPQTGILINNTPATIAASTGPISLAIHPSGKFLYCVNSTSGSIYYYSIDPTSGNLSYLNGLGAADASSIKIHPSGNFAYAVASSPSDMIYTYRIDQNSGDLIPNGSGFYSSIGNPQDIAIDPTGKFAFVPQNSTGGIRSFSIDSSGLINQYSLITPGLTSPIGVSMDPTGQFLYVVNSVGNSVSIFRMDSLGALTLVGAFSTSTTPWSIHFDPKGRIAYVANNASATTNVSIGLLDPITGLLTPIGGTLTPSLGTRNFVVDPSGKYAYSTESTGNIVYMYKIIDSNGNLSFNTPAFTGVGGAGGYAIVIY
ncbi:beta-propeller fold lactonase family protein [Leptospira stimsonii]|uniref:SbsA Ig-like domain-containing protein n=1 Tax=Leptospira stimsonii TaxID=2202203 RepID=A0ABY2N127_9LEPT|nr:beta-propeller fold lactonase family protein [Leptospira stimsonii]TGK19763.1 hypothetical protein EHO98_10795 [Leptospira stimsonii]TGM13761.1 hypothetical protein EHQ90_13190 [Leptospira stimsonii]